MAKWKRHRHDLCATIYKKKKTVRGIYLFIYFLILWILCPATSTVSLLLLFLFLLLAVAQNASKYLRESRDGFAFTRTSHFQGCALWFAFIAPFALKTRHTTKKKQTNQNKNKKIPYSNRAEARNGKTLDFTNGHVKVVVAWCLMQLLLLLLMMILLMLLYARAAAAAAAGS